MTKRSRQLVLRLLILAGSVLLLWHLVDWSQFGGLIQRISPWTFVISTAIGVITLWLTSVRWRLLDPDPAGQLRQWDYFRYAMIGAGANLIMPGALGGDAIRTALIARRLEAHRGTAVVAIFVDRWIGLLSIILLGTIACIAATGLAHRAELLSTLLLIDLAFVVAWILARSRRVSDRLVKLAERPGRFWRILGSVFKTWREAIHFYGANRGRVAAALAVCIPVHVGWFLVTWLLARELDIGLSFMSLSMFTAISWLIVAVPVSFGGLGVRELSFVYLLASQGVDAEHAAVLGAAQSAVFVARALLGVPLIWMERPNKAASKPDTGS